jgi:hypothetical protein
VTQERCPLSVMSQVGCRRCTREAGHEGECEFKPKSVAPQGEATPTPEPPGSDDAEKAMVYADFKRMCANLREVCIKYKLGLGGENLDEVVIAELDRLRGERERGTPDALLRSIVDGLFAVENEVSCPICRPSPDNRHEEACPVLAAERFLSGGSR